MVLLTIALAGLLPLLLLLVVNTNLTKQSFTSLKPCCISVDLPLVVRSSTDSNNLIVDKSVESLGVDILEVAGLGGEGLLDSSLLEQEAAGVTDDGPGDVGGNHL